MVQYTDLIQISPVLVVLVCVYLSLYNVITCSCIHQHSQHTEQFHHHMGPSYCPLISTPTSPPTHSPPLTPNLFFTSDSLSFHRCYIKRTIRASLAAQWLRICLTMQGTRVRALVWEDPTCHGAARPVSHNY